MREPHCSALKRVEAFGQGAAVCIASLNIHGDAMWPTTLDPPSNSAANVLASDESILTTFSYYLGRIDRIFLTKEGAFQVKYGEPSERRLDTC